MSNHAHLVVTAPADVMTDDILRDFKIYASRAQQTMEQTRERNLVDGLGFATTVAGSARDGECNKLRMESASSIGTLGQSSGQSSF
jgi:hypothetical protein